MIKYYVMDRRITFAMLLMGFTALVAQTLAIREFLVSFYGNELTIGLILSNWIILGAAGSFLSDKLLRKPEASIASYATLQAGISLYLPLSIFLIRNTKNFLGLSQGEGVGILPVIGMSLLILGPISIMIGAQFPLGAGIVSEATNKPLKAAGKVYILEGIGFMVAGPIFTYILLSSFNSFGIALLAGGLNLVSAVTLLKSERSKAAGRMASVMLVAMLIASAYSMVFLSAEMNRFTLAREWQGQRILASDNSIYGNLVVSKSADQLTFYSNGIPVIAAPDPDTVSVEERVHFTMLAAAEPRKVLVIGGAGGVIREVLKYPVEKVTYAELDPHLIRLLRRYPTPLTEEELGDPRVHIKHMDGRRFLKLTKENFDAILVCLPSPSSLQLNRFYTRGFFLDAKKRLNKTGVLSLTLPGSLSYISPELGRLNASILKTLNQVFYTGVIPGDSNILLGSRQIIRMSAEECLSRLEGYRIDTALIHKQYIEHRLSPSVRDWFMSQISKYENSRKNTDILPSGVFYSVWHWAELFSGGSGMVFKAADKLNIWWLFVPLGVIGITLAMIGLFHKKSESICSLFAFGSTGFAGMGLSLIMIYAYQSFYGYVFHQIAMLVAAFMVGLALGSYGINRVVGNIKDEQGVLFLIEVAFSGFCVLMVPFILFIDRNPTALLGWTFYALTAVAGSFVGFEFPLVNKIYADTTGRHSSGVVYAVDLAGSWLAALIISVAMVPVLGVLWTLAFLAAIKAVSFILVLIGSRME